MIAAAHWISIARHQEQSLSKTVGMSACAVSHQTSDKLAPSAFFCHKTLLLILDTQGKKSVEPREQGSLPKSFSAVLESQASK